MKKVMTIDCPTETETLETSAELLSVTIGGLFPIDDDIPVGVTEAVNFDAASIASILFRLNRTLFGANGVSANAKVYHSLFYSGLSPIDWVTTSIFDLENQNVIYIYIAVKSEDFFPGIIIVCGFTRKMKLPQ